MTTLLDESEAARLLSLTPRQVVRLANRGELPTVHLPGKQVRFDADDLRQFIERHKRPAAESPSEGRAVE